MKKQSTHKDDELKGIAPTLFNISKADEFCVPEGFFSGLNNNVVSVISEVQELKNLAPIFSDLPKNDLLLTPDEFFEDFENDLKANTETPDMEFAVPVDYFEKQSERLLEDSKRCEAETGLPKTIFEEQYPVIVDSPEQPDKIVSPKGYRNFILSMAAAASAIIAVVFALSSEKKECITFACLLEQTNLTPEDLLFVDDNDLNDFVDSEKTLEINDYNIEIIDYLIDADFDDIHLKIQ